MSISDRIKGLVTLGGVGWEGFRLRMMDMDDCSANDSFTYPLACYSRGFHVRVLFVPHFLVFLPCTPITQPQSLPVRWAKVVRKGGLDGRASRCPRARRSLVQTFKSTSCMHSLTITRRLTERASGATSRVGLVESFCSEQSRKVCRIA